MEGIEHMQPKRNRIAQLSEIFQSRSCAKVNELCSELSISLPTLKRYLDELSASGWEFNIRNGIVTVIVQGREYNHKILWKPSYYTSWKILYSISVSKELSRTRLIEKFSKDNDITGKNEKAFNALTERALDMHLKKLVDEGYITCLKNGKNICYSVNRKKSFTIDNNDMIDLSIALEQSRPFFGNSVVDRLKNSLRVSVAQSVNQERKNKKMLKLADSICLYDFSANMGADKEFILKMEELCHKEAMIEVVTLKEITIRGIAFLCALSCFSPAIWLYLYTGKGKRGFTVIRADKTTSMEIIEENPLIDERKTKRLNEIKKEESEKLEKSFGLGLDKAEKVELIFSPDPHVLEKAYNQLGPLADEIEMRQDNSCYYKCNIIGTANFLHWIRKFGSSVVILSPKWLREKHRQSAQRVLERYGEVLG